MINTLKILPTFILNNYLQQVSNNLISHFNNLKESNFSTQTFSFYTSVSAMASSKIEGETLEIDSYIKHKMLNVEYIKDLIEKPNDLYNAYLFAQKNNLTKNNFIQAHTILATHLLSKNKLGVCRKVEMVVMEHNTFNIQYTAAPASIVANLFEQLWNDIEYLTTQNLSIEQVLYFAATIHLVFVNIHPFEDGNGRAARLLEKWFIAQMLGERAWYLQSELYYYKNINQYYKNLNLLGLLYEDLDYNKALPFLLMLQNAILINQ